MADAFREGIENDPFYGRWGLSHAINPAMLGLRSSDFLELVWDHAMHAYVFRISVDGSEHSLFYALDRFIWELEAMRRKAKESA